MKRIIIAMAAALVLTGCNTTERLAEGIAVKNISGNGTFVKSAVGLNTETKIPEISTIFVSGDYSSAKSGTNSILYRSESTGSIWNAKVATKKQFVSITLVDTGDVGDVIAPCPKSSARHNLPKRKRPKTYQRLRNLEQPEQNRVPP